VASVRILPRHVLEPAWRAGRFASAYSVGTPPESLVTSGAWKLQSFAAGEKTVLAPNPFWIGVDARGQRLPYLDQLVLLILPDANAAALKFAANDGELDALENVRPEDHQRFAADQARGHYTLYDLGPSLTSNFFWFNLNLAGAAGGSAGAEARRPGDPMAGAVPYAWFSNRDFRRAISRAIDRDAMIRGVFFGRGARNWSVITAGNHAFSDPATPAWDYDPAAARQLLAGEGFADRDRDSVLEDARGNPVSFRLEVGANSAVRVQLANFVRDDLARVGIRCQLVPTDFNALVGKIQESHDYQAILGGLAGVIPPDPAAGASFYLSSGSTHFWNARQGRPATAAEAQLDSLFGALARSSDLATRQRLSAQMDRIVADECWLVWLPIPTVEAAVRDRIGNLEPSGFRPRLLWNSETLFVRPAAKH
jgi:peptide/nickel transport system substrate-binding protein